MVTNTSGVISVVRQLVAPLLALTGILGVLVPWAIGRPTWAVLGVYLALPFVGAAVWRGMTLPRADSGRTAGQPRLSFKGYFLGFLVLQWISIAVLVINEIRPIGYYVLISLMVTVVLLQILHCELSMVRLVAILGQAGLILVNITWGIAMRYFYYFGTTDVFPHARNIERLLATQRVIGFGAYQPHPLWHIQVAFETVLFGVAVPPRFIMYFTNGLLYAVGAVAIYVLARTAVSSRRVALLATLITVSSTWVIFYGTYSIPRSVVSFLLVPLLLAMRREGLESLMLVTMLSTGIVVYHTVSGVFLLAIFAVVSVVQAGLPGTRSFVRLSGVAVFAVVQLLYYLTIGLPTFDRLLRSLLNPGGVAGAVGGLERPVAELINYLSFSVLVFLILVAFLALNSGFRGRREGRIAVVSAMILAPLSFPSPLLLTGVAGGFNLLRFGEYTYPFISIAAAMGLAAVVRSKPQARLRWEPPNYIKWINFRSLGILLLVSGMFFAVSSDWTASDNPLEEREFYTFYLAESEVEGLRSASQLSTGFVFADAISCKHLRNTAYGENCHIMEVDGTTGRVFVTSDDDVVMVRDQELDRRALQVLDTPTFIRRPTYAGLVTYTGPESPVWRDLDGRNKIYSSETLSGYSGPPD